MVAWEPGIQKPQVTGNSVCPSYRPNVSNDATGFTVQLAPHKRQCTTSQFQLSPMPPEVLGLAAVHGVHMVSYYRSRDCAIDMIGKPLVQPFLYSWCVPGG